jgi:hypothetical protein
MDLDLRKEYSIKFYTKVIVVIPPICQITTNSNYKYDLFNLEWES